MKSMSSNISFSDIDNLDSETTFFYENYEEARVGTEYGSRVKDVSPHCGRQSLRLASNLIPFYGGRTAYRNGTKTSKWFDAKKYTFVSMCTLLKYECLNQVTCVCN